MEQLIEQSLGDRYQIKKLLGKQTGRRTFLAEDNQTGTSVVVKLILFGPDFTWEDLKLFEREAETLKSLDHSAIPKYLDSLEVDTPMGKGFALVQTYIKADPLREWIGGGYTFSEDNLSAIATSLLSILEYLHCRQPSVIHRDIKPSNILLDDNKKDIYLIDFGSVQTTNVGGTITIVGTYGYMPPEQFGGRALPASDLYSLGATLIYLATGKHPAELTQPNLQIDFDDVNLSPSFSNWLRQLTYADLDRRIPSTAEALQQLTNAVDRGKRLKTGSFSTAFSAAHIGSSAILKSTFGSFSVDSTSKNLVIQLSESHLLLEKEFRQNEDQDENRPHPWIIFPIILAIAIWVLLDLYSPVLWVSPVFFAVSMLGILLVNPFLKIADKRQQQYRLELSKNFNDGSLSIIIKMHGSDDTGWISTDNKHERLDIVINGLLRSWSPASGILKDNIKFLFSEREGLTIGRVDICGSRQQIRWLCAHINQWER